MLKAFKIINNRLNWMSIGAIIATLVIVWIEDEDKKKKDIDWAGNNPSKMDDIYNHYNSKETTHA